MTRLRLALLISLALAIAGVTSPAWAVVDAKRAPCLSSRVGEILSASMAAHALDGALPVGWKLQQTSIASDRIDLDARDEQGRPHRVALRPRGDEAGGSDGQGRWFTFTIDAGGAPLDAAGRRGLLELAARVDAAVPEDEARRVCTPHVDGGGPSAEPGSFGPSPRWLALLVGALEVVAVLGALVFARRARRGGPASPGGSAWVDLAVFVLAWASIHAWGGASPAVWLDTVNDQRDVRQCLVQGACTTLGEATSVDGLHHAVGWLDFLGLAAFVGVGIDPLHRVLQVLSALAVTLSAGAARRAWGRPAGLFAALVCLVLTAGVVNQHALYNSTPLPFLGAVLLLVGAAAVKRPGPASIALTALVSALLASTHSAGVVSVVSVVWIALLAPRNRGRLAALGAAVFVATALAIGPAAWIQSAHHVLSALTRASGAHRSAIGGAGAGLSTYGILMALALAARRVTLPARRRLVDVALAIALPMLAASFVAAATSTVSTNAKYFAHVTPSAAVLAAALAAAAARVPGLLGRSGGLPGVSPRVVGALGYAALALFAGLARLTGQADHRRSLSFHEALAIPRELAARGWTYAQVYRSLRSPDSATLLASFEILAPEFPLGAAPEDPTVVYVAKVETTALPKPLPEGWVAAAEEGDSTLVLAFVRSFLSWSHFAACDQRADPGRDPCVESGLSLPDDDKPRCVYCVPGMPPFQRAGEHPFELRLSVRAAPGEARAILMPARPLLCAGAIASVPGGPSSISANHRRATWVEPAPGSAPREVTLSWNIGSSECEMNAYSGLPPFFFEGDPRTVDQLERLGF